MNTKRTIGFVAAALVIGLVAGNVATGFAATKATPSTANSATATATGLGLRLGATWRATGARLLDVAAKLTGQSTDEIVADRQAGKTYAQIAQDNGSSADALVSEALKVRKSTLDQMVKDKKITQAQADAAYSNMETRLNDRVNSVNTSCDGTGGGQGGGMGRGRGGQGRGMGGGMGGGACVSQ